MALEEAILREPGELELRARVCRGWVQVNDARRAAGGTCPSTLLVNTKKPWLHVAVQSLRMENPAWGVVARYMLRRWP